MMGVCDGDGWRTRGGLLLALFVAVGCRKAALRVASDAGSTPTAIAEVLARPLLAGDDPHAADGSASAVTVVPARCRPAGPEISLGEGTQAWDLEIGDAVEVSDGYAVALVHGTPRGRAASVILLGPGGAGPPRRVELGLTLGDAPPPRLARRANELIAVAYSRPANGSTWPDGGSARLLALYSVTSQGARWIRSVAEPRDDSLAFDVVYSRRLPVQGVPSGVLVWDEASGAGRGGVRSAWLDADDRAHASSTRALSGADSDAELPRIVATESGYAVIWIARREEPEVVTAATGSGSETTGEPRSFGWLEALFLDESGSPVGPVRRLTASRGHVSAFDATWLSTSAPPALLVVARDDGEAVDGSGGGLLRVRMSGDTVEPAVAFVTDGLGRGAPSLIEGRPPILTWVGPHERLRLLPLDGTGAPSGPPSTEDLMAEAQPLAFLGAASPTETHARSVLVAAPSGDAGQLRSFACAFTNDGSPAYP